MLRAEFPVHKNRTLYSRSLNLPLRCNNGVTVWPEYYGPMKRLLISVACALGVVGSMSCSSAQESPACRVASVSADTRTGNAGCLIVLDGKSLLLVHRLGGRLGFPGGTANRGEAAQCTAHRETWEETGLDVEVGAFLKELSTGFALYSCKADQVELSSDAAPPVAQWSRGEVEELVWRDLDSVPEEQWRFPDQLDEVAGLDDQP